MKSLISLLVAAFALTSTIQATYAGDLAGTHMVPTGDPAMADAARKAQAGLDDFLVKLANPPKGTEYYTLKIGIIDDGDGIRLSNNQGLAGVEYFWMTDIASTADGFTALIGNQPDVVHNVVAGQQIAFKKSDIFDWMYFDNGKMKGNYSACPALLKGPREDLEQFKQQYGIDCE